MNQAGRRFRLRRLKALAAEIRRRGPFFREDIWLLRAGPEMAPCDLGPEWERIRVAGGEAVARLAERGYDLGGLAADMIDGARGWAECFLVFRDRQLAHMSQVSGCPDNPNIYGSLRALARHGAVMVGPCVTLARFRGQGLYGQTLRWIAQTMRAEGKDPVLIAVRIENRASVHGVLKSGYHPWSVHHRRCLAGIERFSSRPWPADVLEQLQEKMA